MNDELVKEAEQLLGRSLIYMDGEELDTLATYLALGKCRLSNRDFLLTDVLDEIKLREDHPSWGPDAPGQLKFPFVEDD